MIPYRTKIVWLLLLMGLFLCMPGCSLWDDKDETDDAGLNGLSPYEPPTSIAHVLNNLRIAYEEMNSEQYEALLHEDFTFVFDPRDFGPDEPWHDETWGPEQDLQSTRNMMGQKPNTYGHIVECIRLLFDIGDPLISMENDEWMMVPLTRIDLKLYATMQGTDDEWILQTPGGYTARFHLIQTDETDSSTGERVWKIIRWEDLPPPVHRGRRAPEDVRWGEIKAMWL
jgi:hypothetical protein